MIERKEFARAPNNDLRYENGLVIYQLLHDWPSNQVFTTKGPLRSLVADTTQF